MKDESKPEMKHPNAKRHLQISLIKSVARVWAGYFLMEYKFVYAGSLLILAEVLGIFEELV
jgi:hypothetical protein